MAQHPICVDAECIVGAGAGGASTAYHLSKFAAASGFAVNITVFERNDYIGGRSTTVDVYDDPMNPVELGASIFVKANHILESAVTAGCWSCWLDDGCVLTVLQYVQSFPKIPSAQA